MNESDRVLRSLRDAMTRAEWNQYVSEIGQAAKPWGFCGQTKNGYVCTEEREHVGKHKARLSPSGAVVKSGHTVIVALLNGRGRPSADLTATTQTR